MPLDIDRFEAGGDEGGRPTSQRIIRFLRTHDDTAYTRQEIAAAIDGDPETVGTNLTRLKKRGLVRHRAPYWALTDDRQQVVEILQTHYPDGVVSDLLGTDDWDAWIARAPSRGDTGASPNNESSAQRKDSHPDPNSAAAPADEAPVSAHRQAASAFVERVHDRFDDAIEDLVLFGSVAQETHSADSDVDVLAVIADDAEYAAVDDRLLEIAYDVSLEYGVRIEVHSMRAREYARRRDRGDPFIRRINSAGIRDV